MLGPHRLFPNLVLFAVIELALLVTGIAASANSAPRKIGAKGAPRFRDGANSAPRTTRSASPSNNCVGGYRWVQRSFSVHKTESEMSMPLPCR